MSGAFLQRLAAASLSGGVMILTALLLRLAFQGRTGRRVFCLLWDVSLVRLLMLAEIPSPVSIRVWLPALLQRQTGSAGETVAAGIAAGPVQSAYSVEIPRQAPAFSGASSPDTGAILSLLWLSAALALAAWFLWRHLQSRRTYAASLPCRDPFVLGWLERHPLRRQVQARVSDRVAAPLTYGIVHPVILLPAGMDWTPLSCVLEHEYEHIRRFDVLRKALLAAALCLHWFNPLAWALYVLANRDMELRCDEAAVRAGADRKAYALALLRLEEQRGGWGLSGSHFSQNALEERIRGIMKQKHGSIAALAAVLAVMSVTLTVFASAAPKNENTDGGSLHRLRQAVENDVMILSNGETGERQFSIDGGKSWLSEDEYQAAYGDWDDGLQVEWWSAEDYAAWLEEEKQALQSIIGERGYTGGEGWFTWDQQRVDEAVALYERMLEDIRNGALYSKTITDKDGNVLEDVSLASDGPLRSVAVTTYSENVLTGPEAPDREALLEQLRAFGVGGSEDEGLTYQGQLLRTLVDGAPVGEGGYSIRYLYTNANGTLDAHTLRSVIHNPDGSYDPYGPLTAVAAQGDAGFDAALIDCARGSGALPATAEEDVVEDGGDAAAELERYVPFGLIYEWNSQRLSMHWNGKPVHSLYDTRTGSWFANNLHGSELGDGAVDLQTVYRDGTLVGLTESQPPHGAAETSAVAEGSGEGGQTFAEIFARFRPYGLIYTPRETGLGSLSWNGEAVKSFADLTPGGGAFSYQDPYAEDGLAVFTEYDSDGALTGLRAE